MAAFRSRLLRLRETTTEELLDDALFLHLDKSKRTERAASSCLHHALLHRNVIDHSDPQSRCRAICKIVLLI